MLTGLVESTVHGVALVAVLVLPAASTAVTANVCAPSASPVYVLPVEQALAAPPSIAHRKVTPGSASVKLKVADVDAVGLLGLPVIEGAGGATRSIVQVEGIEALTFPALSVT